jgi:hypothetical protein
MAPIHIGVTQPLPQHIHDHLTFTAVDKTGQTANGQKYRNAKSSWRWEKTLSSSTHYLLVARAISANSEPWGPHGSSLVASRTYTVEEKETSSKQILL